MIMETLLNLLAVAFGFGLLAGGADMLVRGGSRVARTLGIGPMVIGLTVVAYGTSAPEMMASVVAAVYGNHEITVGNVVGSNIANIGLVLGLTGALVPFNVSFALIRKESLFMVAVTGAFFAMAFWGHFGRAQGVILLLLLVLFNMLTLQWARRAPGKVQKAYEDFEAEKVQDEDGALGRDLALVAAGCLLLFAGGHVVVKGAVFLAAKAGVSESVIGVTLVAMGTSLPEMVTSIVAVRRGEAAICVGNLLGSNLFNILGAIGLSAVISPFGVEASMLRFEFPMLLIFTVAMTLVMLTRGRVTRGEGILLLAGYAAFTAAVLAGFSS
jgi:cation:H+ antiporter